MPPSNERSLEVTTCKSLHGALWCEFKVPPCILAESKKAQPILFATFTPELRLMIFEYLDPLDFVSLLLTCKAFLHFFFDMKSVQIPSGPLHSFVQHRIGECRTTFELLRILPPPLYNEQLNRTHHDSDQELFVVPAIGIALPP